MRGQPLVAYVIRHAVPDDHINWRVGVFHELVHRGVSYYVDNTPVDPESPEFKARRTSSGRPTSKRRDLVHVIRSGAYVPDMFWLDGSDFAVSPRVQKRLAKCKGCVDYKDVVFEKLVDLPMPALGDFSWYDGGEHFAFESLDEYLKSLPHVPEYEARFRGYRQLDARWDRDIAKEFDDLRPVRVQLRSYWYEATPQTIVVSSAALREYPVIASGELLFREDAFAAIAPFLDLEYYIVDRIEVTW